MATHSSVLAWRIPGTGEPGGLPPVGLHRVGHDWSDLAARMGSRRSKSILPNPRFNPCKRQLLIVPGNVNWTNWTLKWWERYNSMTWKRPFTLPLGIKQKACWPIAVVTSVQFSRSVMSDSLRPHEPQHARPPCPSPTPRVYSNSCPLSRWCHPTISSSVVPFSSCLQSFPASGTFQMSQLFASGGQSIGVSASASVLPKNTQDWFPLGLTEWISLQSKELSRVSSNTTVQKYPFFDS